MHEIVSTTCSVSFWALFWYGISKVINYKVEHPPTILKIEDDKKRRKELQEYKASFSSLFHAFFLIGLTGYCIVAYGIKPNRSFSEVELLVIKVSFGYFIQDTIEGLRAGFNDIWMTIHHVVMFTSFFQAFYYDNSASEFFLSLFIGEVTNPFNIFRVQLDAKGRKSDSTMMGIYFSIIFVVARGIICPIIAWWATINPNISYILKLNCAAMLIISYLWIWKILNLGAKQIAEFLPNNTAAQQFYSTMKKLRKYQMFWNLGTGLFSCLWVLLSLYYDLTGWPSRNTLKA